MDKEVIAGKHPGRKRTARLTAPRRKVAVLSCMDTRIDLFPMLGIQRGDAHIIRNAGGLVTDDVIRSLSASQRLLALGVLVIAALFMLLVLAFGRARDALLIMVNLPLALIGGVAGVFLAGGVLNVATMIGFITLFGIATRNGIMLVSHIRHLMEAEGVTSLREAVIRGAEERLAPILMTAMAAGLALIPLAFAAGQSGSEIQTPMAVVILFGLMTSTLLNMVVVPAMYLRYGAPVAAGREPKE